MILTYTNTLGAPQAWEVIVPIRYPDGAIIKSRLEHSNGRNVWLTKRAAQRNADQYNRRHNPTFDAYVAET
jgi:hypothetical protein